MQVTIQRSDLLPVLQSVIGVVEKRQTMPILSNILLEAENDSVIITATDLELELIARCPASIGQSGSVTVPARKLLDICRGLDRNSTLSLTENQNVVRVESGKSRFSLATITAADWPRLDDVKTEQEIQVDQGSLRGLLERTYFAMANQDVRYYLNGLLFVVNGQGIRCVATDGHRLALSEIESTTGVEQPLQAIAPRKAVNEMVRLLGTEDETLSIRISDRHLRIELPEITLTTKLIDGRFPDYERVIPDSAPNQLRADRQSLRQALSRTAILSNENYRGVRLILSANNLQFQAQNVDREEAQDEIAVEYSGESFEIGFNITYLLDALGAMSADEVTVDLAGSDSSALIQAQGDTSTRYVVMPMRL
ncbi:DNA polymerase III subunit beta [Salinisphaera sp. USBA-960]|nr:DNA polymerase III subunit beta [Salifodinibacter halophilus]NNC27075.1 DNA polymerase III subunit beta [Salifodinibacter halophilus]